MKTLLKILLAAMLLVPSVVLAGLASHLPVEIDWDEQVASGILSDARFTDNPEEHIGCNANYYDQGDGEIYSYSNCAAVLGDGEQEVIRCYTENPEMVDKIAQLNHYS